MSRLHADRYNALEGSLRKNLIVLAGVAAWAMPATAIAAESELHIEARGGVIADYAVVTMDVEASGRGRPAAEAAIKAQSTRLKARLLKLGIPESAITTTPPVVKESTSNPDDEPFNRYGFAEEMAVRSADYGTAEPNALDDEVVVEEAVDAADALAAAEGAALEASKARQKVRRAKKLPIWNASFTTTIRVDDLRRYSDVAESLGIRGGPSSDNPTQFRFNNPETVHARAVADAVAKARAEAEVYAKAIGGRVLRVSRLSNTETPISGPEVINLISAMENRKQQWKIPATHSASVAMDFVIAAD